jgi:hypothetical protein
MTFLTDVELLTLTGYRQKGKQCQWLRERAWLFELTRTGHPRVTRKYFDQRMANDTMYDQASRQRARLIKPDFSCFTRKAA